MFTQSCHTPRTNRKSATTAPQTHARTGGAPSDGLLENGVIESISWLKTRFTELQNKLRDTRSEVARLKRELSQARSDHRSPPGVDVSNLRRRVAFYCHPDRGGDTELMAQLNSMFDCLQRDVADPFERAA